MLLYIHTQKDLISIVPKILGFSKYIKTQNVQRAFKN